nr:hypothetical protein [Tanacetum cinerariifolium]
QVSVEEFIPDRLKVTVAAAPTTVRPAETVNAKITALNLFGPPAAGRKFEVEFSLKAKSFSAKEYPGYNFDIQAGSGRSFVALTPTGKPTVATAQVTIVRKLWETVLERQGDRYVYNSQKREEVLLSKQMKLSGVSKISFRPQYSGEYEVRIMRPEASSYVAEYFYAYGSGDTAGNSFEVNNEGEVIIEADKPKYEPG